MTPKEEQPQRPFRVGTGGQLEAVSVAPSTGYSMSMISRSGGANAMADTAEAVDATHETSTSSGRPCERRLQTCIACHGSGELPMKANRRLYRLLTSGSVTATAGAAQRPMASTLAAI